MKVGIQRCLEFRRLPVFTVSDGLVWTARLVLALFLAATLTLAMTERAQASGFYISGKTQITSTAASKSNVAANDAGTYIYQQGASGIYIMGTYQDIGVYPDINNAGTITWEWNSGKNPTTDFLNNEAATRWGADGSVRDTNSFYVGAQNSPSIANNGWYILVGGSRDPGTWAGEWPNNWMSNVYGAQCQDPSGMLVGAALVAGYLDTRPTTAKTPIYNPSLAQTHWAYDNNSNTWYRGTWDTGGNLNGASYSAAGRRPSIRDDGDAAYVSALGGELRFADYVNSTSSNLYQLTNNATAKYDPNLCENSNLWWLEAIAGYDQVFRGTVVWDATAPSVSANNSSASWRTANVTITLSASDAASGMGTSKYRWNNSDAYNGTAYTNGATMNIPGDGVYTLYLWGQDAIIAWSSGTPNQTANPGWSGTYKLDTVNPTGTIAIAGGASYTQGTAVTLNLTQTDATSGPFQMRFNNDGGAWTAWEAVAATKAWTLNAGDGVHTVQYQVSDNAGRTSVVYSDTITLDTVNPTGSVSIAGGATYTTSTSVTLNLTQADATSGPYQMRFNNDGGAWSAWEAVAATKAWTLNVGDGTRTVNYQVRDNSLRESVTYTDTIILDTVNPAGSITINGGATYDIDTSVTLTLTYSDATSGVQDVRYTNDGTFDTEPWEAAAASKAWTLDGPDGVDTVYYQIRDTSGRTTIYNDTIVLDRVNPTGTIAIAGGAAYTQGTAVTLNLTQSDATSGPYQMRFNNDGGAWTGWEAVAATKAWTLTATDGTRTVNYQVSDNSGRVSATISDTIVLDTVNPTGSLVIDAGATYCVSTSVTLTLTYADATSGPYQMRFNNDGGAWSAWEAVAATKAWTLAVTNGTRTVNYQVRDNSLRESVTYSDTIILDTVNPDGTVTIDAGASYCITNSVTLSLTYNDATSGAVSMRFNNDGGAWSAWEPVAATKAWTLTATDGTRTVNYQILDNSGRTSATFSDTIVLDTVNPTGSIVIDAAATYCISTSVTLTLTYADATSGPFQMRFKNESGPWDAWEAVAASKAWTLTATDGLRTVRYQVQDNSGRISGPYSDTITLDTVNPTGTIAIDAGAPFCTGTAVTLNLTQTDATSGPYQMRFNNDGGAWSVWEAVGAAKAWTINAGDGVHTVNYEVSDNSGRVSTGLSDTITLDTVDPTGTISINAGAVWSTSTSVTLNVTQSDATSGPYQMRFNNDAGAWSTWEAVAATKAWTLDVTNGVRTVEYQVMDNSGRISVTYSDTIQLDTVFPNAATGQAYFTTQTPGFPVGPNSANQGTENFWVTATITAGQATNGSAELLLNGASFPVPILDGTIGGADTTVMLNPGLINNPDVQLFIPAPGGILSIRLTDEAGNATTTVIGNISVNADYTGPAIPTGCAWVPGTSTANWDDQPDTDDFYIEIRRDAASPGGTIVLLATSNTVSEFAFSGGILGVDYYFRVYAIDSSGNKSGWSASSGVGNPVDVPPLVATALQVGTLSSGSGPVTTLSGEITSEVQTGMVLSAIHNDDMGDTAEKVYIQVSSVPFNPIAESADMWNSGVFRIGRVFAGLRCVDIAYMGQPLSKGVTYYWAIKFIEVNEGADQHAPWTDGSDTFQLIDKVVTTTTAGQFWTGQGDGTGLKFIEDIAFNFKVVVGDSAPGSFTFRVRTSAAYAGALSVQVFDTNGTQIGPTHSSATDLTMNSAGFTANAFTTLAPNAKGVLTFRFVTSGTAPGDELYVDGLIWALD